MLRLVHKLLKCDASVLIFLQSTQRSDLKDEDLLNFLSVRLKAGADAKAQVGGE